MNFWIDCMIVPVRKCHAPNTKKPIGFPIGLAYFLFLKILIA